MKPVRLGMIGLGHIATHSHLPSLKPLVEEGEAVFQAFCDKDGETLKERAGEYGAKSVYTDYHEMFDKEELDAIYLCIPPSLHADELLIAAGKGIHAFVEKPVTLDTAQAVEFNAAVQKAGIVSQVGFNFRYEPAAEPARELLAKRTLRHALLQMVYSGNPIRYWTSRYELCGGSFVENTIHRVDLLRYLVDDNVEAISAFYQMRQPGEGPEPMNLPHVYNVNYRFASDFTANVSTSRVMYKVRAGRTNTVIVGDDSLVEWDTRQVVENGEVVWETDDKTRASQYQARDFIKAVQAEDRSIPRSPYGDSLNTLAAVLGANASAEAGGQLVLAEDLLNGKSPYRVPGE